MARENVKKVENWDKDIHLIPPSIYFDDDGQTDKNEED